MQHSPPQMLNSYLIKAEGRNLSSYLFYEPRPRYIANQSGPAKETVRLRIRENIEMLVCFICVGTHDSTLNDINHHYQITMNKHKNWTWKLNINIYNYCISCLSKKFLLAGGSWISFISPGRWIGNEQLFKVGHIERSPKFLEYALILFSLCILHKFTFL